MFYSSILTWRPFFHFVNKRAIYRLGIISLAHAPVPVTDFPVVNVHVDELTSARIWQQYNLVLGNLRLINRETASEKHKLFQTK
jgi:hypothetical protein